MTFLLVTTILLILANSFFQYHFNHRILPSAVSIHEKAHLIFARILGMKATEKKGNFEKGILGEVEVENQNYLSFLVGLAPMIVMFVIFLIINISFLKSNNLEITTFKELTEYIKALFLSNITLNSMFAIFLIVWGNFMSILSSEDLKGSITKVPLYIFLGIAYMTNKSGVLDLFEINNAFLIQATLFLLVATVISIPFHKGFSFLFFIALAISSSNFIIPILNLMIAYQLLQLVTQIIEVIIFRKKDYSKQKDKMKMKNKDKTTTEILDTLKDLNNNLKK